MATFVPPYLHFRRFNPENGLELEPEIQFVAKEVLEQRQRELKEELETVTELLGQL